MHFYFSEQYLTITRLSFWVDLFHPSPHPIILHQSSVTTGDDPFSKALGQISGGTAAILASHKSGWSPTLVLRYSKALDKDHPYALLLLQICSMLNASGSDHKIKGCGLKLPEATMGSTLHV